MFTAGVNEPGLAFFIEAVGKAPRRGLTARRRPGLRGSNHSTSVMAFGAQGSERQGCSAAGSRRAPLARGRPGGAPEGGGAGSASPRRQPARERMRSRQPFSLALQNTARRPLSPPPRRSSPPSPVPGARGGGDGRGERAPRPRPQPSASASQPRPPQPRPGPALRHSPPHGVPSSRGPERCRLLPKERGRGLPHARHGLMAGPALRACGRPAEGAAPLPRSPGAATGGREGGRTKSEASAAARASDPGTRPLRSPRRRGVFPASPAPARRRPCAPAPAGAWLGPARSAPSGQRALEGEGVHTQPGPAACGAGLRAGAGREEGRRKEGGGGGAGPGGGALRADGSVRGGGDERGRARGETRRRRPSLAGPWPRWRSWARPERGAEGSAVPLPPPSPAPVSHTARPQPCARGGSCAPAVSRPLGSSGLHCDRRADRARPG